MNTIKPTESEINFLVETFQNLQIKKESYIIKNPANFQSMINSVAIDNDTLTNCIIKKNNNESKISVNKCECICADEFYADFILLNYVEIKFYPEITSIIKEQNEIIKTIFDTSDIQYILKSFLGKQYKSGVYNNFDENYEKYYKLFLTAVYNFDITRKASLNTYFYRKAEGNYQQLIDIKCKGITNMNSHYQEEKYEIIEAHENSEFKDLTEIADGASDILMPYLASIVDYKTRVNGVAELKDIIEYGYSNNISNPMLEVVKASLLESSKIDAVYDDITDEEAIFAVKSYKNIIDNSLKNEEAKEIISYYHQIVSNKKNSKLSKDEMMEEALELYEYSIKYNIEDLSLNKKYKSILLLILEENMESYKKKISVILKKTLISKSCELNTSIEDELEEVAA